MNDAQKREKKWRLIQGATLLIPVIIAIALVCIAVIPPVISDYPLATTAEVTRILTELGYNPWERTGELCETLRITSGDCATVSAESGSLEVDFFRTKNYRTTMALLDSLKAYIIGKGWGYSEKTQTDYRHVSCFSGSNHIALIQVRNTFLLVHYDDTCIGQVRNILEAMGYPGANRLN